MSPRRPLHPDHEARLARGQAHPKLQHWTHVETDPVTTRFRSILCKCCGAKIQGLRPVGDPIVANRIQNRTGETVILMLQPVECGPLGNYAELTLTLDNGAEHVTHCCTDCADEIAGDPALLEACYLADIARWIDGDQEQGGDGTRVRPLVEDRLTATPTAARRTHG